MIDIRTFTIVNFKVLVRCFTYNQSKYIEDAINGFVMQKTNFPFVCLVMDDCSTDGEQGVIKAWMDRECDMEKAEYFEDDTTNGFFVRHNTNENCFFAVYFLKQNLYQEKERKNAYVNPWREHCEYEALCEGDDYWIDENKLQKQVGVLARFPNVDMCVHSSLLNKGGIISGKNQIYKTDCYINIKKVIKGGGGIVPTNSIMFRLNKHMIEIPPFRQIFSFDYTLQIHGAMRTALYYMNEPMSVYRVLAEGSWSQRMGRNPTAAIRWNDRIISSLCVLNEDTKMVYNKVIQERIKLYQLDNIIIRKEYKRIFSIDYFCIFMNKPPREILHVIKNIILHK